MGRINVPVIIVVALIHTAILAGMVHIDGIIVAKITKFLRKKIFHLTYLFQKTLLTN